MGRRATEPWHWRNAWYTVREGQRVKLTSGAADDRYARARAWLAFWQTHRTPLVDRIRAVDWLALAAGHSGKNWKAFLEDVCPAAWDQARWLNMMVGERTTEPAMQNLLDYIGVTEEIMGFYARGKVSAPATMPPCPPTPE